MADVNSETLGTATDRRYRFRYIDISSVSLGHINWDATSIEEFRSAPSRARRRLHPGDVLFSTVRPGLQAHAWIEQGHVEDLIASTGFAVLRPRTIDGRYLFHSVFSEAVAKQVRRLEVGSNYPAVNENDVTLLEIVCPSMIEQHRIAKILDTVDEAIYTTERLIEKLKAIKAGLLHDLLTRGIDENGRLRDPIAHPKQFRMSRLGTIPVRWTVEPLGEIATKIQDGTHFSPQSKIGPFRYITSKNVRSGFLDLSDSGWISESEHREIYARCDVRAGDVLLTKDGANTGNAALNTIDEPMSLLSSVAFIRCDNERLHNLYVLQYLLSPGCQQRIKDLMSGNAITRLTLSRIKAFEIPVPPFDEQLRLTEALIGLDSCRECEERELTKLRDLKRGLMHDLLTGKVRVPIDEEDADE